MVKQAFLILATQFLNKRAVDWKTMAEIQEIDSHANRCK